MSGAALGWAKTVIAPSATAKAVLICLADYADQNGLAWPSIPRLAREVQASDRTVQRALRSLEEAGLLVTAKRDRQDGGQTSNGYQLAMTPGDILTPAPVTTCHPPGDASVTPPVTPVSPPYEPPLEPKASGEAMTRAPNDFDRFWEAYPHKVGKKAALRAWRQAKDRPALPRLLAALDDYRRTKPADRSWCNPATWLNQGRWDDGNDAATDAATAPTATYDGPAEIRAWAGANLGEPFVRSYIDPALWDASGRALIAANPFAEAKLRTGLAPICDRWAFTIRHTAANDTRQTGAAA